MCCIWFFFFKQKTAYERRISDWSSDVCSSDLTGVNSPYARLNIALGNVRGYKRASSWLVYLRVARFMVAPGLLKKISKKRYSGLYKIGRASCRERVCQYV